jgi:hypothetical protein
LAQKDKQVRKKERTKMGKTRQEKDGTQEKVKKLVNTEQKDNRKVK